MTDTEFRQETKDRIARQFRMMNATSRMELLHSITDVIVEWMDGNAEQVDRDYILDGILDRLGRVGCDPFQVGGRILDEEAEKQES